MGCYSHLVDHFRWLLLCAIATSSISIAPIAAKAIPCPISDSILYHQIIRKGSQGDPFIFEHRASKASLFSFYNLWIKIYSKIQKSFGWNALFSASLLLSLLWFYSLFRIFTALDLPAPLAFFLAGIQTFFVVNLAYQLVGFKTNFAAYNIWNSEHLRLYPTVTAMAFYMLAVWLILRALTGRGSAMAASAVSALVYHGRPFDWMVLMGAIFIFSCITKDRRAWIILAVAAALTTPFLCQYALYQKSHSWEFLDQLTRGNMHIKGIGHYVKYGILCSVLTPAIIFAHRSHPTRPVLFVCCLAASSLLVHFKTLLDGGVTIVGPAYLLVFSAIPWCFTLATATLYYKLK